MSSETIANVEKLDGNGLSEAKKARIERNRLKALSLKAAKLVAKRSASGSVINGFDSKDPSDSIIKINNNKYVDSGGGFLIEESEFAANKPSASKSTTAGKGLNESKKADGPDTLLIPITHHKCEICDGNFVESYLWKNYGYRACDSCHKPQTIHTLITKTEAKEKYLLKDCDFDKREPPLRYITRKNPHSKGRGEMKLYLHLQVEQRALEVWGSMEELERQIEERIEKNTVAKIRKYNKKMKKLRMEVRSSLYTKTIAASHVHDYDEEVYHEEEDNYTHVCKICSFKETFEKI